MNTAQTLIYDRILTHFDQIVAFGRVTLHRNIFACTTYLRAFKVSFETNVQWLFNQNMYVFLSSSLTGDFYRFVTFRVRTHPRPDCHNTTSSRHTSAFMYTPWRVQNIFYIRLHVSIFNLSLYAFTSASILSWTQNPGSRATTF